MMTLLAKVDSIPEAIVGFTVSVLPLAFFMMFVLWVLRLIKTLRERIDSIEDKLDLVLMWLETAKKPQDSKTEKSE